MRSSPDDPAYGTHVLITPSTNGAAVLCDNWCGGIAYLDVFANTEGGHQPAWVFTHLQRDDPKYIADTASHEAGHNLGLSHDGTSTEAYHAGSGHWSSIMGGGWDVPIVQWSQGSYPDANNHEDDLAILRAHLGSRPDEAPGSPLLSAPLPAGQAWITTPQDADSFVLGTCTPGSTVTVSPAPESPNLDVVAELHDTSGLRATSNPPSGWAGPSIASGMGATLTVPAAGSVWVLRVDGGGHGTWANQGGYDDYGSLGSYTVSAPGCDGTAAGVPSAPTDVAVSAISTTSLTLSWAPPTSSGAQPISGYVVGNTATDETVTLPATARSHTFTGLAAGTTYDLVMSAANAAGTGPTVTTSATTHDIAPSAPTNLDAYVDATYGFLEATWDSPEEPGTKPIDTYRIDVDGVHVADESDSYWYVSLDPLDPALSPGTHTIGVTAISAAGASPRATASVTIPVRPTMTPTVVPPVVPSPFPTTSPGPTATAPARVARPRVRVRGRKVVVRWKAPATGGSAIKRYRLDLKKGKDRTVKAGKTTMVLKRLKRGKHRIRIRAHNGVGAGAWSGWVRFRVR